jgi:hypothetical protein
MKQPPSEDAMELAIKLFPTAGDDDLDVYATQIDAFAARKVAEADDPQWDGTDAAHPAWWRGNDRGCRFVTQRLTDALDGKDDGAGWIGYPPLEALRRRLLAIADHREVLPP